MSKQPMSDDEMSKRMWETFKAEGLAVLEVGFPQRLPMACERCVFGTGEHSEFCKHPIERNIDTRRVIRRPPSVRDGRNIYIQCP